MVASSTSTLVKCADLDSAKTEEETNTEEETDTEEEGKTEEKTKEKLIEEMFGTIVEGNRNTKIDKETMESENFLEFSKRVSNALYDHKWIGDANEVQYQDLHESCKMVGGKPVNLSGKANKINRIAGSKDEELYQPFKEYKPPAKPAPKKPAPKKKKKKIASESGSKPSTSKSSSSNRPKASTSKKALPRKSGSKKKKEDSDSDWDPNY